MYMPRSHRFWWPLEQDGQRPQAGMNPKMTRSPGATEVTPGPTSSITAAPSWPPIIGSGQGRSPVTMCSSEWHSPDPPIRTRTSPAFGGSSSISSIFHGVPNSKQIAARVVMLMRSLLQRPNRLASQAPAGERPFASEGCLG